MSRLISTSREQWLEQRRSVLTATELAEIASSPAAARRIRKEKSSGEQSFGGNKYTRWGQQEERFIGRTIIDQYESDMKPNTDLWISDEDPNLGATPDLILENKDGQAIAVGEIKTVIEHRDWGDGDIPKRYYDQVQAQLLVTGAERCIFGWEPYADHGGVFFPTGPVRTRVIKRDEKRIGELLDIADAWFAGDDGVEQAPLIHDLLQRRLVVDRKIAVLQEERDSITAEMSKELGDDPQSWTYEGLGTVTVTKPSVRKSFDKKRFEKDHPDLAVQYVKESQVKGTVRFTPEKKEEAA